MEAKLFFTREENDNIKVRKAVAALAAAGSIFGLAGCGGGDTPGRAEVNAGAPGDVESSVTQPAIESPVVTTPQTRSEQQSSGDILFGESCESVPGSARLTTYTVMATINSSVNKEGDKMSGLKENAAYWVRDAINHRQDDLYMQLTDRQEEQIEQSVDAIVDEEFGGDVAPNEKDRFETTLVIHTTDGTSQYRRPVMLAEKIEGMPAATLDDTLSVCIESLKKYAQ